jgi:hypothetical protein
VEEVEEVVHQDKYRDAEPLRARLASALASAAALRQDASSSEIARRAHRAQGLNEFRALFALVVAVLVVSKTTIKERNCHRPDGKRL